MTRKSVSDLLQVACDLQELYDLVSMMKKDDKIKDILELQVKGKGEGPVLLPTLKRCHKIIDKIDSKTEIFDPLHDEMNECIDYLDKNYSIKSKVWKLPETLREKDFEKMLGYLKRMIDILIGYSDQLTIENFPVKDRSILKELKLHPKIIAASQKLFYDKHYSQSIFEAVKTLEKEIKAKSKINDRIGVSLVDHVFNKDHPIIKIVEGDEIEQKDEREGFRFLYRGAFLGIKNPKSHSMPHLEDPAKAIEYLSFLSLLMKRLDESSL